MDALEFQADPVVPHPSIIPQQQRSFAVVSHQHVDVPIIVEVADGEAAGRKHFAKTGPAWERMSCSVPAS